MQKLILTLTGMKKLEIFAALLFQYSDIKEIEEIMDDVDRIFEWAFPNEHDEQQKVH